MNKLILTFGIAFFLFTSQVYARWANYNDASTEIEFYKRHITINEDGSTETTVEIQEKILRESGRQDAVEYKLFYNGDSSKVTILEAKTLNDSATFKVDNDRIEDKPTASLGHGFDEMRRILISYPNVQIGSRIYIKYKEIKFKPEIDKFFSDNFYFGNVGYCSSGELHIDSKIPLYIKVNDPDKVLHVTNDTKEHVHYLDIKLVRPIYTDIINEPQNTKLDPKHLTWVSVSSVNAWDAFASKFAKDYNVISSQNLPQLFETIATAARNQDTDVNVINTVISKLNEQIQYMGDWRSVSGRFTPRSLDQIAMTQVGDCKDFSISTVAILSSLGYIAEPVLVQRGIKQISIDSLPTIGRFNHAMVKVTAKDGKLYWVDPTNIVSMADGIFPDIADRYAIVLNKDNLGSYEHIPAIDYNHAKANFDSTITLKTNNVIYKTTEALLTNEIALDITGWGLYASKQQIEDAMFVMDSGTHLTSENKKEINVPDLTSRIVSDIKISMAYDQENALFKTNLGLYKTLNYLWVNDIINVAQNQISDLFIGIPKTITARTYISNMKVPNAKNLDCEIKSPWLHFKRYLIQKHDIVELHEIFTITRSFITQAELKSAEYLNLKKDLEQNVHGSAIVFN